MDVKADIFDSAAASLTPRMEWKIVQTSGLCALVCVCVCVRMGACVCNRNPWSHRDSFEFVFFLKAGGSRSLHAALVQTYMLFTAPGHLSAAGGSYVVGP